MDTLEKGYGLRCVAGAVVDSVGCVNRSTGCCCGPLWMELEREAPPGCGWGGLPNSHVLLPSQPRLGSLSPFHFQAMELKLRSNTNRPARLQGTNAVRQSTQGA